MRYLLGLFTLLLFAFTSDKGKVAVYLIGDSTMADKEIRAYPETGWGMPFKYFFDSTVVVDNRAKNGRSTRTFLSEGLWAPVVENLKAGDYVFIQFGHNDEVKEKVDRFTSPEDFRKNLRRYVDESLSKKANPILISPVSRRKFDKTGAALDTHPVYTDIVREVALEKHIPFIDLDAKSKALYQQFGEENSKLLFMQLEPGENPNYPEGRNDNTHFNELGARKIAEIMLAEIKAAHIGLADHIVKPKVAAK